MALAFLQVSGLYPRIPSGHPGVAEGAVSELEAKVAMKATLALFDRWNLDRDQQCRLLGDISARTLTRWRHGAIGPLGRDIVERLGYLLGIHKALRYLFQAPERGYDWLRKPNEALGGLSALDVMMDGSILSLARIRAYLDSERGAW